MSNKLAFKRTSVGSAGSQNRRDAKRGRKYIQKNPTAQSHDTFWILLVSVSNCEQQPPAVQLASRSCVHLCPCTVHGSNETPATLTEASHLRRLLFWTGDRRNHLGHVALSERELLSIKNPTTQRAKCKLS